ncbi:MAG TPA: VOC family protein [Thermoleophilaceae bacterium]|nr:VOC family protein [Thermoleophilaceae bacterium]
MSDTTPQMKLEVVLVPVADVDRAKEFYGERLGFNVDHDTRVSEQMRIVQLTPRGSACSVVIGSGLTEMPPGSLEGLQLVVRDIEEARNTLGDRGVASSEVELVGPPDQDGSRFIRFSDPDGNRWAVQELRGSFAR